MDEPWIRVFTSENCQHDRAAALSVIMSVCLELKSELWSLNRTSSSNALLMLRPKEKTRFKVWPYRWVGPETESDTGKSSAAGFDFIINISI